MDAQADLSLRWAHTHFVGFVMSRLILYNALFRALCGLYYEALHVLKSSHALCLCVSSFLLALWSPRLGKRELVYVLLVHLFICIARIMFCPFSLPLEVGGWLRFVIVVLPGRFYLIVFGKPTISCSACSYSGYLHCQSTHVMVCSHFRDKDFVWHICEQLSESRPSLLWYCLPLTLYLPGPRITTDFYS